MTEIISDSGARLITDFAKQTEYKSETINTDDDFDTINDNATSLEDDFEPVPEYKSEPITDEEPVNRNVLSVETSASLYVGVFDSLQQMLLTTLHKWKLKRKIGNDKDLERFEELSQSVADGLRDFNDLEIPDRAKVRILERVKKKVNDLPFTDSEYEQLEESLLLILKEMPGYQLPPNYALMMAMANVMLPRVLDVIVD
ncbi:MAG: hypothetical protein LC105_05465 [Chitinophagales bacterium]|nr:hypothetical protein [Chitinophagales bacterium]